MAGYGPIKFFFCVFMDRDGVEVHKHAKKEQGQYPANLTEKAWSIKDLLFGFRGNFSRGTRRVVPSGQDSSILPARVANHSARFGSSYPPDGASRIIDPLYKWRLNLNNNTYILFPRPYYSRYLLRCIFFLAAPKKCMGRYYGQSLEMDLDQL